MSMYALVVVVLSWSGILPAAQSSKYTAPESFRANAQVSGRGAGAAAAITFQIDAYTADADRERVIAALRTGGSAAFLDALKKTPAAGSVQIGNRTVTIRWAREQPITGGRHIVLVTDAPVHFVGAGEPNAAAKAGYDVAVVQFNVDSVGLGSGTMAAAARVKPGGVAGVQVDDYAQTPIKLVTVTRNAS